MKNSFIYYFENINKIIIEKYIFYDSQHALLAVYIFKMLFNGSLNM